MPTRRDLLLAALAIALAGPAHAAPRPVMLYKSPGCGCCDGYVEYLKRHGFAVTAKETTKLAEISRNAGIPAEMQGCHTAFIGGYAVDGHVPVEAIEKLLAERPDIKGIVLPGMPEGSPGMSGNKSEPFAIQAIGRDGKPSLFMTL